MSETHSRDDRTYHCTRNSQPAYVNKAAGGHSGSGPDSGPPLSRGGSGDGEADTDTRQTDTDTRQADAGAEVR